MVDVTLTSVDTPVGPISARRDAPWVGADLVRVARRSRELHGRACGAVAASARGARLLRCDQGRTRRVLRGRRTSFELPIDWSLTGGFGRRVLERTARIPYGEVSTYKDVAAAAGSPRGARAAGNALGANPIPIVVPCHRVLHSDGGIGGYGGGIENKQFLLRLEGAIS